MLDLYASIENPLVDVLAKMEHVGIAVDIAELRRLNDRLTAEVERLGAELVRVVGRPFNLNSPIQLREILYTERQLAPSKKTKTGFSTDAATLEKLRDQWPEFIDPLLQYREVEKLRGTYGTGLIAEVAPDGRIHATFNQTVARTGRLSSDQPNLHNIPVRREEGRQFRRVFMPAPGQRAAGRRLQPDRAALHRPPRRRPWPDRGVHLRAPTSTTPRRRGCSASSPRPSRSTSGRRRRWSPTAWPTGWSRTASSQRLNIPVEEAAGILDAYFEAFPNVKAYMDQTVIEARMRGYTETLFGRRRPIPELSNSNFRIRQAGERQAMNAGIQGLAADIFKVALVRVDQALVEAGVASRLVLQVHDEVLVEVPEAERDQVGPLVIDLMRHAAELDVPLEVNVAWGTTWADAKT